MPMYAVLNARKQLKQRLNKLSGSITFTLKKPSLQQQNLKFETKVDLK